MAAPSTASYYLTGHMAPVPDEIDVAGLEVTGALPPELSGRYLRNGPNPKPGEDPGHWFMGHGMIHGIRIDGGRAEWYRNRWVRTGQLEGRERFANGGFDLTVGSANTHVMSHAGRIYALVESSFPYELTPELETVGPCDFGGKLTTGMTAHPKEHPATGDLHFFGYGFMPPFLTYHRLSAAGHLDVSVEIPVRGATMNHDFAITENHALFLDQPMTFQMELLATGMPFGWDDSYGTRIGVMPLDRPGDVTWFDVDPCYVFHVGNAHEDSAGRIVLEAPRHGPSDAIAMWGSVAGQGATGRPGDDGTGLSQMHRWTLDPATGAVTEERIDDRGVEFPTLDDRLTGRHNRYLYTRADAGEDVAVVKYDTVTGASTEHVLGTDVVLGEAEFVASTAPDRAEDDGWLMAIVSRRDGSASQLLVLDASDVAAAPVATVRLPRPVPTGFHGSWIPDWSSLSARMAAMTKPDVHAITVALQDSGVAGVTISWADNNGIPRSRTVPVAALARVAEVGVGITSLFAVFDSADAITFAHAELATPSGDVRLLPVLDGLVPLAGQPALAWAPGRQLAADGSPWPYDQRAVLERQVEALAAVGLTALVGYEMEFGVYLDDGSEPPAPAHYGPAYSPHALVTIDGFVADVLRDCAANGLVLGQLHAEYGPAQMEISLAATDPVTAADNQLLARQTLRVAAKRHGLRLTFAPLPASTVAGNGWHIHTSVWRGSENLLAGGPGPEGAAYIAGLLRDLPAVAAVTAPSHGSLARLRPGYFAGAFGFWGVENREAPLRYVPGSAFLGAGNANVELKTSDASANPYLALAAVLAAGRAGIAEGLELPEPVQSDPGTWSADDRANRGIVALPTTAEAQEAALTASPRITDALGPALLGAFLAVRRSDAGSASHRELDDVLADLRWRY